MDKVKLEHERATVELDRQEMALLQQALNEVCNGVHISDAEFTTRLGAGRAAARRLLDRIRLVRGEMRSA